jgi:hypothetical protein
MKNRNPVIFLIFFLYMTGMNFLAAQNWEFIKEKDGIKIYTRKEADNAIKSFKGEAYIHTQMDKINSMVGNVSNQEWWDKDITTIKILINEKDKHVRYYLVYDVPWPVTDRDLVVDAIITTDPVTGVRIVEARSIPNIIPEQPGLVRIKKYWQKWTITPMDKGIIHVVLEGSADPGGSIPAWIYNMVITETPLKVIRNVKTTVAKM